MEINYLEKIESGNILDFVGFNKSISERKDYSNIYT